MKKIQRTLRLNTETIKVLSAADLPRVAGGLWTEPEGNSSFSKAKTHCPPEVGCVVVQPK